jgi:hypothetical protein
MIKEAFKRDSCSGRPNHLLAMKLSMDGKIKLNYTDKPSWQPNLATRWYLFDKCQSQKWQHCTYILDGKNYYYISIIRGIVKH